MSFTIIILSLQDKLLCEFCIIFTSHYFTYRMSCLHGGISKTSSVHFTQLPVSNMKFPYGITSYWTLMICLEWTFKVYLCVAGFSYARTCIGIPCNFGTCSIYADKRNKMSFLEEFYDCSKDFVSLAGVDIHSLMMLSFCSSSLSFFSIRLSRSVVDAREALNTKPFFRYYQFKAVIIGYHGCCFRYRASLHSG